MSSKNATMSCTTLVAVCKVLPAERAVLVRGDHGIGKSAIIGRAMAKHFNLHLLDFRLGQRTPGDIIGMPDPDKEKGVTRFLPPEELELATRAPCLLFFDELNRAVDEVLQAVFQICLDRKLPNGKMLHPETRVYAAINAAAVYTVTRLDPALLDRFFISDLEISAPEWLVWARGEGNILPTICDYVGTHHEALKPAAKCEPDSVQPTPRSWEFTSTCLRTANLADKPDEPLFFSLCVGFVGVEVATAFTKFAKEAAADRISGKDVLKRYTKDPVGTEEYRRVWRNADQKECSKIEPREVGKLQAKVRQLPTDGLNDLIDQVGKEVCAMKVLPTAAQGEAMGRNLRAFCDDLPSELRLSLWAALTANGTEGVELAKWWHPWIAPSIVTGAFHVPVGEEGIGVNPDIPGSLSVS